jgi:hypothetical protein
MKNLFKQLADRAALALMAQTLLERPFCYLAYRRKRVVRRRVEARLREMGLLGDTVLDGPFKGMRYPSHQNYFISGRFEKVIGYYEQETHSWIADLVARKNYDTIFNIGAAEGSFAVGLALLFPRARIYAFEPEVGKVAVIRELARLNGVEERLTIGGWCDPRTLTEIDCGNHPLVVCDVDGYEEKLMDSEKVPWLTRADVILEVHEFLGKDLPESDRTRFEQKHSFLRRDIADTIRARFDGTHKIIETSVSGVPYERYPILNNLTMEEISAMTESDRACIHPWFLMESKFSLA